MKNFLNTYHNYLIARPPGIPGFSCLRLLSCLLILIQIGGIRSSIYDGDEWSEWSDWTPCSRTCDGGVTQQFRRCKSPNGCHGVSIRRKMCNMQGCGGSETKDYRGDQCRAFNGNYFKGERRNWEPIEDPDNPCALTCRAQGSNIVARLSPKLRDGTRCRSGALHVCVDGRCETVGCDLKLGSPKKIDACGICGGDSKSCTSPLYQWELKAKSPCTRQCGGGTENVRVICKNGLTEEKAEEMLCSSATKPHQTFRSCNIHPCEPEWETGVWSVCSTTCGGGLKIRKVFCAQEKNATKIQVADKLCNHIRRPSNQETCNGDPCPHWHAGPWSLCSETCGKGYKTRNVVCRDAQNLPSGTCESRLQPSERKSCEEKSCPTPSTVSPTPITYPTSRSPTKKRRVKTESPTPYFMEDLAPYESSIDPTDDLYVEEEELPREHTLPLIQPYPPMDNAVLFDQNAIPSEPTKVRVYFACGWLFLSFVAEEWGGCSTSCGQGVRKREVNCKIFLEFSRTIANLPDKECPGPKPPETEACFGSPCPMEVGIPLSEIHHAALADSDTTGSNIRKTLSVGLPPGISIQDMTFSWKVLGYSPCSASCLGGIQEAMIQCVRDYDQRIATPVLCMDKAQPDIATTRTCNDHPCPPRWNVSEFGVCSKPCGGGVMTREVSCIHEVTRGNTVIVPTSICPSPVPRTEMLCNAVNCPPYWEPGDWNRCSKPCGGGIRSRTLHCKQVSALGQVVELGNGNHHCTQSKPIHTKSCNKKACPNPKGSRGGSSPEEYRDKVSLTVKGRGTVYAGVALKLRCPLSKGHDTGSLIWMKGHEYVNVQPQRIQLIHKAGVLKIKNVTYSDSGLYTCIYNERPVSNITLMVKPYTGDTKAGLDKRPRGRSSLYESTLFADQQRVGVSVPMSDGQVITPNSEIGMAVSSSASSHPSFFLHYKEFTNFLAMVMWYLSDALDPSSTRKSLKDFSRANFRVPSIKVEDNEEEGEVSNLHKVLMREVQDPKPWRTALLSNSANENEDRFSSAEITKKKCGTKVKKSTECGNPIQMVTSWKLGKWSDCDPTDCFNWNTALKRRQLSCVFPNRTKTLEEKCGQPPPSSKSLVLEQECYNPQCIGIWHLHPWSYCKARCESVGFRTRMLKCVWYGSGQPAGLACHSLPRPVVKKRCRGPPCSLPSKPKTSSADVSINHTHTLLSSITNDLWHLYDNDHEE